MEKKKLPIGIKSFEEIRQNNYYYADKTTYLTPLTMDRRCEPYAAYYFLSRPPLFGKTVLLDTVRCLFEGRKELFKGLYIYNKWPFTEDNKYPVIVISLSDGDFSTLERTRHTISKKLDAIEEQFELPKRKKIKGLNSDRLYIRLFFILNAIKTKYKKKSVVLIDDYDKPILDAISDTKLSFDIRLELYNMFCALKDRDAIHFSIVSGVSLLCRTEYFYSASFRLNDITIDDYMCSICGFTQKEIDDVFASEIKSFDIDEVRRWYYGFHWDLFNSERDKVFCPYSILELFKSKEFKNYRIEKCSKNFHDVLNAVADPIYSSYDDSKKMMSDWRGLSHFDLEKYYPKVLLFQCGYLTISGKDNSLEPSKFILNYPNDKIAEVFKKNLKMIRDKKAKKEKKDR